MEQCNDTGVDFIWEEENADVKTMPYTLEAASFYIDMGSSRDHSYQ